MRVRRWLDSLLMSLATIWPPTPQRRQEGCARTRRAVALRRLPTPRPPPDISNGLSPAQGQERRPGLLPSPLGGEGEIGRPQLDRVGEREKWGNPSPFGTAIVAP